MHAFGWIKRETAHLKTHNNFQKTVLVPMPHTTMSYVGVVKCRKNETQNENDSKK